MELRDFAEAVLFSEGLEKKLSSPPNPTDVFTDRVPKSSFETPPFPIRDKKLKFHEENSGHARLSFPNKNALIDNQARAKVFHAFANHELLAMELMALALLKFPDAPISFRKGLALCITEEQAHLKLYVQRMNELGVGFGDFPINGFFWNVLKGMSSPLEFVSSMSLTFEQANLDFSSYYISVFKELGDLTSSQIMERVFREEVGHVKFGVQWFENWRPPTKTQWDFYRENLAHPLTPQRAKGIYFSPKHREGTGLQNDYLEQLEAFSHSKGRPPKVFLFNASCELEWSAYLKKQSTFQAPKSQLDVSQDLASLMMFLGHEEDVVALATPPSLDWIRKWRQWGFPTANFIPFSIESPQTLSKELATFKIASFEPWGWSPKIADTLRPFKESLLGSLKDWPPFEEERLNGIAPCFQKTSVPALLSEFIQLKTEKADLLPPMNDIGTVCTSLDEVLSKLNEIIGDQSRSAVIKSTLGSSGFNMIRILSLPINNQELGWIKNSLSTLTPLVVEAWQKRCADFSAQIEIDPWAPLAKDHIRYLGFTRLLSDRRGQYAGHQLGSKIEDLPEEIRRSFYPSGNSEISLSNLFKEASLHVGKFLVSMGFKGPAGIDMYLYHCPQTRKIRLNPIVEINSRYTMGRISLALEEKLSTGSKALWIHMSRSKLEKLGFSDWTTWLDTLNALFPMELVQTEESEGMVRLKSGVFPTNDPSTAKSFLSVLAVGRELEGLRNHFIPELLDRQL